MDIYAEINGIKYNIKNASDLKEINFYNFDINTIPSYCLINNNKGMYFAISKWSEPLSLDTLSLNTPYIPESYSLPITSHIPLEADSPKRNATSSYYTHLL